MSYLFATAMLIVAFVNNISIVIYLSSEEERLRLHLLISRRSLWVAHYKDGINTLLLSIKIKVCELKVR